MPIKNIKSEGEVEVESVAVVSVKKEMSVFMKVLILAIALCAGLTLFFWNQARVLEQNPDKVSEKKILDVVEKVSELIDLPTGELPTLATVTDATVLSRQTFFKRAKIGDQVLLYAQARQAYLYDPKAHIILEVASLNLDQ